MKRRIRGRSASGTRTLVALILVAFAGFLPGTLARAETDSLAAGSLLVASRGLLDPNFSHTVVLLVNYDENGAMGLIINRPTEVDLSQMVADMEKVKEGENTVWVGGPVAHWQLVLLVRSAAELEGADRVLGDVHFTGSREVLESVLESGKEFRAYAGYAGWGAGQLEGEIDRGGWHVLPGDPGLVFDSTPLELWKELIARGEARWASLR